ncbi:MAG: hypothetical protein ABR529_01070 [Actinomycetota bacterium]
MKVVVNDNTQVNHGGKVYGGGETLDVPGPVASTWLQAGWVRKEADSRRQSGRRKK